MWAAREKCGTRGWKSRGSALSAHPSWPLGAAPKDVVSTPSSGEERLWAKVPSSNTGFAGVPGALTGAVGAAREEKRGWGEGR